MKRNVKKALQAEVDLWRDIGTFPATYVLGDPVVRPLCNEVKKCQNCPVKAFTGESFCVNTPLWEWKMRALQASRQPLPENLLKVADSAGKMMAFLAAIYKHS